MKYIIGPELLWIIFYTFAIFISKSNISPVFRWDDFIDKCWFYVPALAILTFVFYWIPGVEKSWLLLRIWVACLLGAHFSLEKLMSAYSQQGPGAGIGYLAGLIFVFAFLIVGSILIIVKKAIH